MKKNYYYLLLIVLLSINFGYSQGANCASSDAFCAGGSALTFPNSTGTTSETGIDYECLGSQPNPAWFYMQIATAGNINFQVNQATNGGTPIDVDYILWGPFPGPSCGPASLNPATSVSCSFSAAAVENFTILNAVVGDVYVVLLTNYSGQAGNITVTQTNAGQAGAGATDCNIVCPLSLANQVICPGAQAILTATIAGATTYQWSSSVTGPIAGNTQSITVTQPATYTVVVNKPGCVANATASATVSFNSAPPINLPVNLSQCSNLPNFNLNDAAANIFNGTGLNPSDYEIYFHTTANGAQNLDNSIPNPAAYPGSATGATIYMSVTDNGPTSSGCISVFTFTIGFITCNATPVQPPNLTLCESSLGSGTASFDFIPQIPIILGTNNPADYTVSFHLTQTAADNDTGAINPINAFVNTSNPQTIYVRMEENANPLTFGTTSFQLIVNPLPTATISGTTTICSGTTAVITFNGTPNTTVTYTVDSGTNQPILLNASGTNSITTPNLTANSVYTLVSVTNTTTTCTRTIVGSATVTVRALPTAIISGTTAVCQNAPNPTITFTGANGTVPYTFTYSINNVVQPAITTIAGNSISVNAPTTTSGVFTYSLVSVQSSGVPACSQNQSGTAIVTVNALPTATITGSIATCLNSASPQIVITGANATPPYTFTYTINNVVQPPLQTSGGGSSVFINVPTTTAGTFTYDLVSVQDGSASTCAQLQTGSAVVTVGAAPTISTPTDYVVCDDNNDGIYCAFDLNTKINEITGGDPSIVVNFYETDTSGSAIPLNVNYCNISQNLQTIYVRAYSLGSPTCFSTTTFNLIVNPLPIANPVITDYELCDYTTPGDNTEQFTLTTKTAEIANGQPNVTVSYYVSQSDATNQINPLPNLYSNTSNPQQIWINIRNNATGCNSVSSFNLVVNPLPVVTVPEPIFQCSNGATNQAQFDLTLNEGVVTGGVNGLTVTYYNTQLDAQNETSPIATPLSYLGTDNETVYLRVENDATGCYATTTQLLRVTQGPTALTPQAMHYCDPNNDGFGVFNLDDATAEISGGTWPVPGVSIGYYETETDALLGTNPSLVSPYENIDPWTQTIYVRVFYTLTGCANYVQLQLIVDPTPEATTPDDYAQCDYTGAVGYESFDLTTTIPQILGSIDPSLTVVTFHTSQTDADDNTNAISNVTNYINGTQWTQTLYVRVETIATGCYDTVTLNLIVNPIPNSLQPNYPQYSLCDYTGALGFETFDLESKIDDILLGQTGMSVTFYPSLADATNNTNAITNLQYINAIIYVQTLGIRITNTATSCYVISTMDIRVEPLPTPIPPTTPYTICDDNQDGYSCDFDLTTLETDILQGAAYILSFYETQTDAELGDPVTAIDTTVPYCSILPFTQILYVRAQDPLTGCWSVIPVVLNVNPSPVAPINLDDIVVCDQDNNPYNARTGVDLTQRTPDVLALQPATGSYTVSYYNTEQAAIAGTAPIINNTNHIANTGDTIWVRVEDNVTGCYNIGSFKIIINTPLLLTTPTPLSMCDDDANPNDQRHSFDLTIRDVMITQGLSGYTVAYYPSLTDAQNNTNVITNPTAYIINGNLAVQTLGVVVTNIATGCKSITTLDIRVLPVPTPRTNPPTLGAKCDDNNPGDMMELFDLTVNAAYIANGDPAVTLHYYHSQADALVPQNEILTPTAALVGDVNPAEQSVWIRVENSRIDYQGNHCAILVEQPLTVNPLPTVVQPLAPYRMCDNDTDGIAFFDLTNPQLAIAILGANQLPADYTISYYATAAGANPITNTGETPLPASYQNVTPDAQDIYIRVVNNATGCVNATGILPLAVEEYAQATGPQTFASCDDYNDPYDGIHRIDLTQYETAILNGQDPLIFLISYYHSQADAEAGINAIALADAQAYVTTPDTDQIWVKVENSSNTLTPVCYALTTIDITVERYPNPIITTQNGVNTICVDFNAPNAVVRTLTLDSGITNAAAYTFEWFEDASITPIPGATGSTYTVDTASPTGATRNYTVRATSISLLGCATTSATFAVIQSGQAVIPAGTVGYTVTNAFTSSQIITVDVVGFGTYEYSLDDGPRQTSNIFENVSLGSHVIHVWDTEGGTYSCEELVIYDVQIIDYPHYFTPNGDGIHDTWNIKGLGGQETAKIYIFDRYGKLLKQISSAGLGWDGTYNGQLLPATDYWFSVDYVEPSTLTAKQFKAHFSLKR